MATLYFNLINGGIPFDPHSTNPYHKTSAVQHTNNSNQNICIYQNFLSHRILIQSQTQQNKTINQSQDSFQFTLSKMQIFIHQQQQNKMSKLSIKLALTTHLEFLFLLYFPRVFKLDSLEPKHKIF